MFLNLTRLPRGFDRHAWAVQQPGRCLDITFIFFFTEGGVVTWYTCDVAEKKHGPGRIPPLRLSLRRFFLARVDVGWQRCQIRHARRQLGNRLTAFPPLADIRRNHDDEGARSYCAGCPRFCAKGINQITGVSSCIFLREPLQWSRHIILCGVEEARLLALGTTFLHSDQTVRHP